VNIHGQEYEVFEGETNALFDFLSIGNNNLIILRELNGSKALHVDRELYSFFIWSVVFEARNRIMSKRGDYPPKILDLITFGNNLDNPTTILNMAEVIMESCLLIYDTDERLQLYSVALDLIFRARRVAEDSEEKRQLLRSYHLECFVKFYCMKYRDEERSIQDVFDIGEKIIYLVEKSQTPEIYGEYHSLGYVWKAYGLIMQYILVSKDTSLKKRRARLTTINELVNKAVELGQDAENKDRDVLSTYVYAFAAQMNPEHLFEGGLTDEKRTVFIDLYDNLSEVATNYNSPEFVSLAALNIVRLHMNKLIREFVFKNKKELFTTITEQLAKLDAYKGNIHLPHLHFYQHQTMLNFNMYQVYFEAVDETEFEVYIDVALRTAEEMRSIYSSSKMIALRERLELHHLLTDTYLMKASLVTSRAEKHRYLHKCEEMLLEDEKLPSTWSTESYNIWRDFSSVYFELSQVERDTKIVKKCIRYAKLAYNAAKKVKRFLDALYEVYKIAIVSEDYQDYESSTKHFEIALQLVDTILKTLSDNPYFENLKIYLQARLLGVQAKQHHRKGNYPLSVDFYREASSLLKTHNIYTQEAALYNVYSLFEEASDFFLIERYDESLKILTTITNSFDELTSDVTEDSVSHFQYHMDRRAYDQQLVFLETVKTFCAAQSNILQSLIYRNTGDSRKAIALLDEANTLLSEYTDRDVHIAGYALYTNGLYALELSEVAIRDSEYRNAASYLASASDQFASAAKTMSTDEGLRRLCEGLHSFCHGWMYALEILRRDIDLNIVELSEKFIYAHQSFVKATQELEIFEKTSNSVSGFERLLSYFYYSLLLHKTDDQNKKTEYKDKMVTMLTEALEKFNLAEDTERFGFTRDLLATLPSLAEVQGNIFAPLKIPFSTFTPMFKTTDKVEPSGVNLDVTVDKSNFEVGEKIRYTIHITSDSSVYLQRIDGVFPKEVKVVSGVRIAKRGSVQINSLLSAGQNISIEFVVSSSTPLYSRKHPQLIYNDTKNEKCRAFTKPITMRIYPKGVLKSDMLQKIEENIDLVKDIIDVLGINVGEFPVVYHNIDSFRKTLVQYYIKEDSEHKGKRRRKKRTNISRLPIQQMAFVDPLGDVSILYDLKLKLFPHSLANLLNIIIHEKFGHGFFLQHTNIGKKLLELEYHRKGIDLLMRDLEKISNKYATGFQWLRMSTIIVDEGFAVWLTIKALEKLYERITDDQIISQVQKEIEDIKRRAFENSSLQLEHEYFLLKHALPRLNPYAHGFYLCSLIEEKYGALCVPLAITIASDIKLTRQRIARMPTTVKNDKNCADKRLEKIALSNLKIERNNRSIFEEKMRRLL